MKQIVGDYLYDTEKSERILTYQVETKVNNLSFVEVKEKRPCGLYVTNKGNYFKCIILDESKNDIIIRPISQKLAKNIIKTNDADLYMKLYDDVEEA